MITIRPYIEQWITETKSLVKKGDIKILCQAPTGSGKTIYSGKLISELKSKRVLFVAPRRKLVFQTAEKFRELGITDITLIMGREPYNEKAKVCIGTSDSVALKDYGEFDYIFIDEIHQGFNGNRIKMIFDKYADSAVIGLSATPIDAHGYLLEGFDSVIDSVDLQTMQEQSYATHDVYEVPFTPDFSKCRIDQASNEFNIDDIASVMDMQELTKTAYSNWLGNRDRKTMIFCTNIKHAENVAKYWHEQGQEVNIVHSKMSEDEITENYRLFQNSGNILINVDMATFGFDDEDVSCIILLRPIHSLRLYIQVVGRGLRKKDGKEDCLVQDYGGNFERHGKASDRRKYEFRTMFSKVIDKQYNLDLKEQREIFDKIPEQKKIMLKRVGRLLDLYWDKEYPLEDELLDNVKKILKHMDYFHWRQNSGSTNMAAHGQATRWVHFTDIKGLPDITMFAKGTSMYIGIELKSNKGSLNENQLKTLPKMKQAGLLIYLCRDIRELWAILLHIIQHIEATADGVLVKSSVYNLWTSQYELQKKLKLL